ncbi:hypothetical protein ILUMI_17227, partial [Ignelater luminosus]
ADALPHLQEQQSSEQTHLSAHLHPPAQHADLQLQLSLVHLQEQQSEELQAQFPPQVHFSAQQGFLQLQPLQHLQQNERNSSSNRSKQPKKTKRARCALARYKKIRETGQPIQCQPNVIEAEPSAVVVDPPTSTEPEIVNDLSDADTCTSSESHFKSAEECMKCPTWCIRTYNKPQKQPKQVTSSGCYIFRRIR